MVAALVIGAVLAGRAQADTNYCSPNGESGHHYGEVCLYGSEFLGDQEEMQTDALSVPDGTTEYEFDDMWLVDTETKPGTPYWIESGIEFGEKAGGSDVPEFVWADKRPLDGMYFTHYDTSDSVTLDHQYFDQIYRDASSPQVWYVRVGPYGSGGDQEADDNTMVPNLVRTGTEEDFTTSGDACDGHTSLEYMDEDRNWSTSWYDSSHHDAQDAESDPPYVTWISQNVWSRDWSPGSAEYSYCWGTEPPTSPASSAATTTTTSSASSTARASRVHRVHRVTSTGPLTEGQITQIAQKWAAQMGDPTPSSIEHVEGPRQQAVAALSGDGVPSTQDVDAIVMTGRFVDNYAPLPYGAAAPSGSALEIIIDSSTGQLTDLGLTNQAPNLASLGLGSVTIDG